MRKEVHSKWIEALRGEEYKQTFHKYIKFDKVNNSISHCVIGVLYDLYFKEEGEEFQVSDDVFPKIHRWAGIAFSLPEEKIVLNKLACFNDSGKYSFKELADIIEKEVKVK